MIELGAGAEQVAVLVQQSLFDVVSSRELSRTHLADDRRVPVQRCHHPVSNSSAFPLCSPNELSPR